MTQAPNTSDLLLSYSFPYRTLLLALSHTLPHVNKKTVRVRKVNFSTISFIF